MSRYRIIAHIPFALQIDYVEQETLPLAFEKLVAFAGENAMLIEVQQDASLVCWRGDVRVWRESFSDLLEQPL